jgi:proline iminopeptidase
MPLPVSPFTVVTPDAVIRGTRVGDGPPVVLLHGGPGCYDYFEGSALVDWLPESCGVFSYDQRGCRHSTCTGPLTMQANVADLEAVRRFIGAERIGLLGHSAGVLLGAGYVAEHPDRVAWFVAMSPAPVQSDWRRRFEETIRLRATLEEQRRLDEIDLQIRHARDPAAREELYRRRFDILLPCYVDPGRRPRAPRMEYYSREVNTRVMASFIATCRSPEWRARVGHFTGPSTVIHGRTDPVPWSVAEDWAAVLPGALLRPLDHCGHFPWLEEPAACRAALFAFLDANG